MTLAASAVTAFEAPVGAEVAAVLPVAAPELKPSPAEVAAGCAVVGAAGCPAVGVVVGAG
jgi:hypothetical protein